MFQIEEELKKLPGQPGVYIMHDAKDAIIYVGKAISLKNRVRQYFQSSRDKTAKIKQMVSKIARFEYIVTDSELEALVLECNLIKEHRPRYNTMLKDDKTYPYIKVTASEEYPRILFSRQMKKDKNKYFGPFTSAGAVKDTIELIRKIYRIRACSRKLPQDMGKDRPCLYYHIHQCDAPCQGYISQADYQKSVKQAVGFLNGQYEPVMKYLEEKMRTASETMEFEKAIEYRDLLDSVRKVAQKQKITSQSMEDRDIIAMAKDERDAVVQVFFVRDGKLIGREHFHMNLTGSESKAEILNSFVKQFYAGTPFVPHEIWVQEELEDAEVIASFLTARRGQKVRFVVPKMGEKERLVELAEKNAKMVLSQDKEKIKREELRTIGAMNQIGSWIGLSGIKRVEAYDISNISGFESVGSMIVYENGRPKRNDYRKFRIKTVQGPNDYASMEEVLTRRFTHESDPEKKEYDSFGKLPDLIMMDGGRGQVNIALGVLEKLDLNIPVCGMVKDDFHRTRALYYNNEIIEFPKNSEAFRMITRLQDEAHRFAITYHKALRGKEQVHSVLDDIKGIGPARRKSLMKHFKDIGKIKEASVTELCEADGITENVAEEIYRFFHEDTSKKNGDVV